MMKLSKLEVQFKSTRNVEELNALLQQYLADLKITMYSFTYYSHHTNVMHKLKYDLASPKFEVWHKHYLSEHYEEIDSDLETTHRITLPIYWNVKQQLEEARTPKERQMRLDTIEFGAEKGLSIPIHGPQEDFATFLVVQMKGESCLENWQELQHELFVVAHYYYAYLQKHLLKLQQPVDKYQLSKRDIQCLLLLAKQYSVPAMAEALNITERTVNYHIQRLNKKLGTKNKYQSVTKALNEGLIKR